jgi:hypothetical protein
MSFTIFFSNFKVSRNAVTLFAVSLGVFLFSLYLAPYYYDGDQVTYTNVYEAVSGHSVVDGFLVYQGHISSVEPIHYLIIWMASNLGLEKNHLMAFSNSILAYLLVKFFLEWRVSLYVALAIIFTNFYVLVLYFSAERLKFSFIFLLLSLLYSRQHKLSYAFAGITVLAHAQQILIYVAILFASLMSSVLNFLKTASFSLRYKWPVIGFTFLALAVLSFMSGQIASKFSLYNSVAQENSLISIWKSVILFVLALLYSSTRLKTVFIFFIILSAVVLVGPERVNMIAYCFFMFYALQYKRGVNAGVAFTLVYFGFKGVSFILDVIETGQGFH